LQHLSYWLLQGKQSLCGFFVVTTVTNIFLSLNQMMITSPHEYVQQPYYLDLQHSKFWARTFYNVQ